MPIYLLRITKFRLPFILQCYNYIGKQWLGMDGQLFPFYLHKILVVLPLYSGKLLQKT